MILASRTRAWYHKAVEMRPDIQRLCCLKSKSRSAGQDDSVRIIVVIDEKSRISSRPKVLFDAFAWLMINITYRKLVSTGSKDLLP